MSAEIISFNAARRQRQASQRGPLDHPLLASIALRDRAAAAHILEDGWATGATIGTITRQLAATLGLSGRAAEALGRTGIAIISADARAENFRGLS